MAQAGDPPRFTVHSWRDLVLQADPDFHFESKHPIVYRWPKGNERRDGEGPYANPAP